MKGGFAFFAAAFIAAMLPASAAHALDTVYTSFGPQRSFDHINGFCVDGPANNVCTDSLSNYIAAPFVPLKPGTLDHLDLAISNFAAQVGGITTGVLVALVSDDGGVPAENVPALEEWVIPKLPLFGGLIRPTKLASKLFPVLDFRKTYWIVVIPGGFDGSANWHRSTTQPSGGLNSLDGGATWGDFGGQPAFDVWIQ
jgi:hypothetical protein